MILAFSLYLCFSNPYFIPRKMCLVIFYWMELHQGIPGKLQGRISDVTLQRMHFHKNYHSFFFSLFCLAAPLACGSSWARGQILATGATCTTAVASLILNPLLHNGTFRITIDVNLIYSGYIGPIPIYLCFWEYLEKKHIAFPQIYINMFNLCNKLI